MLLLAPTVKKPAGARSIAIQMKPEGWRALRDLALDPVSADVLDSLAEVFQKLGNAFVAAITVVESPVNLEQLRGFTENLGDVAIFHAEIIRRN